MLYENKLFLLQWNQNSIPTLEDSGYVIWDSHAIIAFLVGKYGQDDSLYPRDNRRRSIIDQRLRFDSGVISFFAKTILVRLSTHLGNSTNSKF